MLGKRKDAVPVPIPTFGNVSVLAPVLNVDYIFCTCELYFVPFRFL